MNNIKTISYISMFVIFFILSVFGVTYSWVTESSKENLIAINNNINVEYNDSSLINLNLQENNKIYENTFTLSYVNKNIMSSCFNVSLHIDYLKEDFATNELKYELIDATDKKSVTKIGNFNTVKTNSEIRLINNKKLDKTKNYELHIWLDENKKINLTNNLETLLSAHIVVTTYTCN